MLINPTRLLTKPEKYILSYIAKKGPSYGYKIYRKSGYSDKTIYVNLKNLVKKGLLEIYTPDAQKKKRSRGRPVNTFYSLTLVGLCYVLSAEGDLWKKKHFNRIVKNLGKLLPSIFKRWKIFDRLGYDTFFKRNLKCSIDDHVLMTYYRAPSNRAYHVYEESILFDFIFHILEEEFRPPTLGISVFRRLNQIFRLDSEFQRKLINCSKILWLDSIWRTALYEERKNLFELHPSEDPLFLFKVWNKEAKKLNIDQKRKEIENALHEWPISTWQFAELIALHAIWRVQTGQIAYEFDTIF